MRTRMLAVLLTVWCCPHQSLAQEGTEAVQLDPYLRGTFKTVGVAQAAAASQNNDRENWIFRHLVIVGTLAGTGAGGVVAANVQRGEPAIVLGGALGGAYAGLVASAVRKASRGEQVGGKTKFGILAGAIGVGVASLLLLQGLGGV